MARLGYSRYGVQGGDWGGIIGRRIAQRHSGAVAALHTNIPYAYPPKGAEAPESYKEFRKTGTAYLLLPGTNPDSMDPALSDSPLGLATTSETRPVGTECARRGRTWWVPTPLKK